MDKDSEKIAVLDIGGTSIKSGLWEDNRLCRIQETGTDAHLGAGHVVGTALHILKEYGDFQAIGISTAGQVDAEKGTILYANDNLPGYTGTKLKEIMEKTFHVPTSVQNDVNSAAMGEAFYGAGQGYDSFLCLTYGTGVGGAIFMDGEVYTGTSWSAGEFGGIVTHPEDRDPERDIFSGCYERYASATALVKKVHAQFSEIDTGRAVFAQLADLRIRALVEEWIGEIVLGLTSLVHIFNPSLLILGGGVMEQAYIIEEVRRQLQRQLIPSFRNVKVRPASLGNTAGMLGAVKAAQKRGQS